MSRAKLLKEVARYESVPLSDSDVRELLNGEVNIVQYRDLHKMRSIDQVLGPHGAAVILFESRPRYGHWCALTRGVGGDPNALEFYDPYGRMWPDDNLKKIGAGFAAESKQDAPYLSLLMLDSPYDLSYNQHPLQMKRAGVQTCGRHCVARIMYRDLGLDEFNAAIRAQAKRSKTTPDAVVSALTSTVGPRS